VGVEELQEAWEQNSSQIGADYLGWDANRDRAVAVYREALTSFLDGNSDLSEFRTRIDSLSKSEPHWGFRGTSQMFFNQLVRAADPDVLSDVLKAVLPAPSDENDARRKLELLQSEVEDVRKRAEAAGTTKPGVGRIDSFVSFFWELQEREQWPMFFPNSRDVLEQQDLLDLNQSQPDLYLSYRDAIFRVREALGTDVWGVEHLLWRLGQGAGKVDGDGHSPNQLGDLYARYRDRDLFFPDEVVTSLVLSLATKRFAILSGISGTGKTRIALELARYLETIPQPTQPAGEEDEPPSSDPRNIYIRITAPKLRRGHMSLVDDARRYVGEALGLPKRGASRHYTTKLPDGSVRKMRLNNVDFTDQSRQLYRLFLLKHTTEWLRANSKAGDFLRLRIRPEKEIDFGLEVISRSLAEEAQPKRHAVIAVRSDWTDPRGLIGYFNPLTGSYARTELIDLLLRAGDDPERPYVVILDEMNLARVEYYFSDFLSAMESGEDLRLMAPGLEEVSESSGESGSEIEVPGELAIPANVSFIGTVNVDETTHAFSPKVLDRANIIEFGQVDVERALGHGVEAKDAGLRLRGGRLHLEWLCTNREDSLQPKLIAHGIDDFTGALEDIHAILAEHDLPFGYRVINEISAFVGHALGKTEGDQGEIVRRSFDLQVQQKIIPKLSGGRELEPPLASLLDYCVVGKRRPAPAPEDLREKARHSLAGSDAPAAAIYPGSARRLLRMLTGLDATGFVGALG